MVMMGHGMGDKIHERKRNKKTKRGKEGREGGRENLYKN